MCSMINHPSESLIGLCRCRQSWLPMATGQTGTPQFLHPLPTRIQSVVGVVAHRNVSASLVYPRIPFLQNRQYDAKVLFTGHRRIFFSSFRVRVKKFFPSQSIEQFKCIAKIIFEYLSNMFDFNKYRVLIECKLKMGNQRVA